MIRFWSHAKSLVFLPLFTAFALPSCGSGVVNGVGGMRLAIVDPALLLESQALVFTFSQTRTCADLINLSPAAIGAALAEEEELAIQKLPLVAGLGDVDRDGIGDDRAVAHTFGEVPPNVSAAFLVLAVTQEPPDAFAFQHVLPNGTRVDCMLTLPAPTGLVAVDAKFPLENYHRMLEIGAGEHDRRSAQQAFRGDVKRHVDAISSKYILPGIASDGAVMFLPAEAVFAEIHAYHPEVVAHAQRKRVWIVSPTTLMAVLNTARAVMKDVETRKQIHVIKDALGKLAKDFQRFDERMAALARHIEQASRDVQDVQTSSRKITAHFHKIESARLDEVDELEPGAAVTELTTDSYSTDPPA